MITMVYTDTNSNTLNFKLVVSQAVRAVNEKVYTWLWDQGITDMCGRAVARPKILGGPISKILWVLYIYSKTPYVLVTDLKFSLKYTVHPNLSNLLGEGAAPPPLRP